MESVAKKLERSFEGYLALILLVTYTVIIMYDVTLRTVYNRTTLWGFSLTLGIFAWVCWLTASLCIRTDSHLRFTLIRRELPNRVNFYLRILDVFCWWIVIGIVFYYSLPELLTRYETGVVITGTSFPTYLLYASVPVGTGLMLFRSTQNLYFVARAYRNGENVIPDASI